MEEEAAARRRRSSRSRSKPPMEAIESRVRGEGGVILSEQIVTKVSRFQTIEEIVSHESVSVQESTMFVQTDAAIELQNSQNQKQEVTKSLTAKTGGMKKVRRSVRAQHTSVNGSAVRKSAAARQEVQAEVAASKEMQTEVAATKELSQTTPVTTRSASRSYQRTTDPNIARRLYERATRGEVDLSKSVFWRFYKPIGEWWNYYPKTDNTYSPLSSCRYELAPGMMAMPNLSRRSLHGHYTTRSAARSSWYSGVDSDTEDFIYDDSRSVRSVVAGGFVSRVTSRVKRVVLTTITTIVTIISLLYSYTLGAVVSAILPGSATTSDSSIVPLWLLPLHWLMGLTRRLMLLEAWILSLLGVGQRRNLLMFLLLLLLFGVPVYLLYAGGYEFTVINTFLAEIKASIPVQLSNITLPTLADMRLKFNI